MGLLRDVPASVHLPDSQCSLYEMAEAGGDLGCFRLGIGFLPANSGGDFRGRNPTLEVVVVVRHHVGTLPGLWEAAG